MTTRKPKGMDPVDALKKVVAMVLSKGGYFSWTIMSDPPTWLLRTPQINAETETWMKDEKVELIHYCHPVQIYKATVKGEKENLAEFSGYVKNGICTRCNREAPADIVKKATTQRNLYEIARKTQ